MEKRCGGCGALGVMSWNTLWGTASKTIPGSAWRHWWLADLLLHGAVVIQGPWGSGQQNKRSRVQPAHQRQYSHSLQNQGCLQQSFTHHGDDKHSKNVTAHSGDLWLRRGKALLPGYLISPWPLHSL